MSKVKSFVAICVGLLALTALAGSASAASWKVNGALLTNTAALATTANVTESGQLKFSTVTVECVGKNLEGVTPQIAHSDSGSASSLKFTSCTATGGNCALVGTTISTVPVTALAQTVSSTVLAVFKPKTKTVFATLEFSGASCAFSSEVQPVTGTALVTAPTGGAENTLQEIVANTSSGELKVGSSAATLKGKAQLQLASSLPWSFR